MKPETVLITGASSGIGLELAKCFAAEKSNLILVARNREALEKLAAELRKDFLIHVEVLVADLSKSETPQHIFDELQGRGVIVDVLVNNAGFGALGSFASLPLARQLEMLQVNIAALTDLTGLFLPGMLTRQNGGIMNVGSLAGFQSGPGMAVYFATKAYVLSFTEAIAEEIGGSKVIISAFCPGSTATNFGNVARGGRERKRKLSKMTAAEVAAYGHRQFRAGKIIAIPGIGNQLVPYLLRLMPRCLTRRIVHHFNTQVF